MRTPSILESLPNEVMDIVLHHYFAQTPQDYPGSHKAELRIYDGHVILRRVCPIPPPRFKGCRALMRSCKVMYHNVLEYMYSRLEFEVIIYGNAKDPGQRYNRLTSEYPLGRIATSMPLRYIKSVKISLSAWSTADLDRLKIRLSGFLDAIKQNGAMNIRYIGFYTKTSMTSTGSADELAKMLEVVKTKVPTNIYSQDNAVSQERMHSLLSAIGSPDIMQFHC